MKESPIFTRVHDLLRWLLPATRKFPRDLRFVLAERLVNHAFAVQDALVAASLDRSQQARHLVQADIHLTNLRKTLLLCFDMELFTPGQYRHVSEMVKEVGNLLGGWKRGS